MKLMPLSLTAVLIASFLLVGATASEYDPWLDSNYDGNIDIFDIVRLATIYGSLGIPINTTQLLLDLNASTQNLQNQINAILDDVSDRARALGIVSSQSSILVISILDFYS